MEPYQYTPVDSDGSEIRILTINADIKQVLGRAKVKPLSGKLTNYRLPVSSLSRSQRFSRSTKIPAYHALSYVWGDPQPTHEILIDGKPLGIAKNLYSALRGVQGTSTISIRIWVDAICINQKDLSERSSQVKLMREVYYTALEVRVWLGESTPKAMKLFEYIAALGDTDLFTIPGDFGTEGSRWEEASNKVFWGAAETMILKPMQSLEQTFTEWGDIINNPNPDTAAEAVNVADADLSFRSGEIQRLSEWRPLPSNVEKANKIVAGHSIEDLFEHTFIENEWFSRMWVVQELGVAYESEIQLGPVTLDWLRIIQVIYYLHSQQLAIFVFIGFLTGLEKIRFAFKNGKRHSLRNLIHEFQYRRSTDPRDKIYSLYGLMIDPMSSYLKPDYTLPVNLVFANTTRHFISLEKSLDILCDWQTSDCDSGLKLPSWVPDYTLKQDAHASPLVSLDAESENLFAASGYDHRSRFEKFHSSDQLNPYQLKVCGIKVDEVSHVSIEDADGSDLAISQVPFWRSVVLEAPELADQLNPIVKACLHHISDILDAICAHSYTTPPFAANSLFQENHEISDSLFHFISQNYVLDAFIHTIFCGRTSNNSKVDRMTGEWLAQLLAIDGPSSLPKHLEIACWESLPMAIQYRRLAVTKAGYIGAVPEKSIPDDILVVLYGSSVPIVLRPIARGKTYQFIGECYLHGFMDAEAIVLQIKGDLQEDSFILV